MFSITTIASSTTNPTEMVTAIKESLLQFDKDSAFVEVETGPQQFEKRYVKTGLSDGLNIEIVSGVTLKDKIKIPQNVTGK